MDTDAYPHYKESRKQTQEPVQKSDRPKATILRPDLTGPKKRPGAIRKPHLAFRGEYRMGSLEMLTNRVILVLADYVDHDLCESRVELGAPALFDLRADFLLGQDVPVPSP